MTHTVKSGETLSKIAKAHKITLAQLLDANPKFKANPNRVRVGDVLNIPNGDAPPAVADQPPPPPPPAETTTTTTATTPPTPPQPQPAAGRVLGQLSAKYETGGRGPGVVSTGAGDAGGASYGSYQMTSKPSGGTVKRFVSQPDFPFAAKFRGLTPGGAEFTAAWKQLAKTQGGEFQAAQHDYIKQTHFDPFVKKIINEDGLNVLTRSHALQDVIWSTAVQHGPGNSIAHRALANVRLGPQDPGFDRAFITAIYAERGRKKADGNLVYFGRNSAAVQKGVANRFKSELQDALKMLAEEGQ
jgi:LysM repeat protein